MIVVPGIVPRVRAGTNVRVPDLAVTCVPAVEEDRLLSGPTVVIEILSPGDAAQTWSNVWTYTTIPSVREIVVVRSTTIGIEIPRRGPDGTWPVEAELVTDGDLVLDSIDFRVPVAALYRATRLAAP